MLCYPPSHHFPAGAGRKPSQAETREDLPALHELIDILVAYLIVVGITAESTEITLFIFP